VLVKAMLVTVNFNDDMRLPTLEIDDVWLERRLTAEMVPERAKLT
jgi:hypothetical protein